MKSVFTLSIVICALASEFILISSFEMLRPSSYDDHDDDLHIQTKRQRSTDGQLVQLCGPRLLRALGGLCRNYRFVRRSDPAMLLNGMVEEATPRDTFESDSSSPTSDALSADYSESSDMLWNRSPKLLALKFLGKDRGHKRYRRNIIDDCCKRPCTFNHLLKYCHLSRFQSA